MALKRVVLAALIITVLTLALLTVAANLVITAANAEVGIASWYGSESGSRRADGHSFNPSEIVCAHRTLPLGSVVIVTDLRTRRSIRCPVRDRGPARWTHRIIDLSQGAARALGILSRGTARVSVVRVR